MAERNVVIIDLLWESDFLAGSHEDAVHQYNEHHRQTKERRLIVKNNNNNDALTIPHHQTTSQSPIHTAEATRRSSRIA